MALKIEDIEKVLRDQKLDVAVIKKVVTELEEVEEENKAERGGGLPKQKNQFVIVVKGTEELKDKNLAGWVVQIPEGDDVAQTLPRIKRAAAATVNAQKRKKRAITTIADAMQYSKRAFTKIENINVKTKEYVQVVITPGDNLNSII
jgi:hypothetical protein